MESYAHSWEFPGVGPCKLKLYSEVDLLDSSVANGIWFPSKSSWVSINPSDPPDIKKYIASLISDLVIPSVVSQLVLNLKLKFKAPPFIIRGVAAEVPWTSSVEISTPVSGSKETHSLGKIVLERSTPGSAAAASKL